MTDLARRAVACRHFRWLPGMLTTGRIRITCVEDDGAYILGIPAGWHQQVLVEHGDRCPDLTDHATLGCLLALVREAHGAGSVVYLPRDGAIRAWRVLTFAHGADWLTPARCLGEGATEAEALVAALESAP